MKLTDALLGEHGVFYALFEHIEQELPRMKTLGEVQCAAGLLTAALVSHARIEDEQLFPALDPHLGPAGPLAVMRHEHTEIDGSLAEALRCDAHEAAVERLRYAIGVARDHFAKEEQVLFNIARRVLAEEELARLGERWAGVRGVALPGAGGAPGCG